MKNTPKVSVIIPVYKAEPYIEKCARSLFEQTLDDIEYIFINDCTPDKSMEVLQKVMKEYPNRKSQIKIIEHETNKGISAARNSGLNNMSGEYLIHCDSDDWVDADLYEKLYNKAVEEKADIVMCDYNRVKIEISTRKQEHFENGHYNCLKGLLTGRISPFLWNKLIRTELYTKNSLSFPEGINIREDFLILTKLFYYSKSFSRISDSLYYYRIHEKSISRASHLAIDNNDAYIQHRIKASQLAFEFLEQKDITSELEDEILTAKLNLKFLIIFNSNKSKYWNTLFREINSSIFKTSLPLTQKLILLENSKKIGIILWLYKGYRKYLQ